MGKDRHIRNERDPMNEQCAHTKTPADTRPLIVRLMELEAIPPADRSVIQMEAVELWQTKIGSLAERRDIVGRFIRKGGPFDKFTNYLSDCGLNGQVENLYVVLDKAIESAGFDSRRDP